jgi:hypothetical protein
LIDGHAEILGAHEVHSQTALTKTGIFPVLSKEASTNVCKVLLRAEGLEIAAAPTSLSATHILSSKPFFFSIKEVLQSKKKGCKGAGL